MWRRFDWRGALRRNGWLLALLAYMFLSTLWSDITLIALRRFGREVIVVIMALVLMAETDPRKAVESVLRRSAYVLIPFSLLLIKYYPALGVNYAQWSGLRMWIGVSTHKNSLSCLCLVSAFFLIWAVYRRWRQHSSVWDLAGGADISVLLIALFLLKGEENAYSATSLASIGVGIVVLVGLLWLRRAKLAVSQFALVTVTVLLMGFGISAPFVGGSNVAVFSSSLGRDATLTGRTDTWAQLVPVFMSQPVSGSGFGSFWTTARRDFYQMSHGHNGYLDSLLELGGAGLWLYMAWLLSCVRKLYRGLANDYEWSILGIGFLLMALVYNTTESAFSSLASVLTAAVVLVSAVVPSDSVPAIRASRLSTRRRVPPALTVNTSRPLEPGGRVHATQRGARLTSGPLRSASTHPRNARRSSPPQ
jgi:O-antigen ligase